MIRRALGLLATANPVTRTLRAGAFVVNQNMAGIGTKLLGDRGRAISRAAGRVVQGIDNAHSRNVSGVFGDRSLAGRIIHHDKASSAMVAKTMGGSGSGRRRKRDNHDRFS